MKLLRSYIVFIPFLIGGYLGYRSPSIGPTDALLAALIGAFIASPIGIHTLLVISPTETIADLRTRGLGKGAALFVPIAAISTSCIVYIVFRDLLGAPSVWKPILVLVLATGITAILRIRTSRLPNGPGRPNQR